MQILRTFALRTMAAGALLTAGCSEWLTVADPTVIDVGSLDPVADAGLLASSAQQNFAVAYGWLIMYSGWFTGESDVAETFPTRNEFGRRDIVAQNGSLNADVWVPLSRAASASALVIGLDLPTPESNINYARSHLWYGYSMVLMAEQFCEGTVRGGAPLTTAAMLDTAITAFGRAISIGNAAGGTAGTQIANTALVGRARAHLQAGNKTAALADANAVPAGFVFNMPYVDDLGNRTRLGNRIWQFIADRGSQAVAPIWRVDDPRVPQRVAPGNLSPQDAFYASDRGVPYVIQDKYPAFSSPIRVASKIEADYIAAEATGTAAMLALIQARRAANGQSAYTGGTGDAAVLQEFFTQRGLEFYLEGKRLGDFRRAGAAVIGMPEPGSTYWKPGFAPVGNQSCYPLPIQETDNNTNFP
jgi:starch-binding outer membrane protein, SusD/RagB family